MNKFLSMTRSEVTELKGAALKELAAAVAIPGRSSMKADELRTALLAEWELQTQVSAEYTAIAELLESDGPPEDAVWETVATIPAAPTPQMIDQTFADVPVVEAEAEEWTVVPNRAARREAARKQRKAAARLARKNHHHNH